MLNNLQSFRARYYKLFDQTWNSLRMTNSYQQYEEGYLYIAVCTNIPGGRENISTAELVHIDSSTLSPRF